MFVKSLFFIVINKWMIARVGNSSDPIAKVKLAGVRSPKARKDWVKNNGIERPIVIIPKNGKIAGFLIVFLKLVIKQKRL
jgi:hypothetical protein